jgi:hypothetical protein
VAFIEAFRRRGIYPQDVRTLSEDSLRWGRPEDDPRVPPAQVKQMVADFIEGVQLRKHVEALRYCTGRREIWNQTRQIRKEIQEAIKRHLQKAELMQRLTGLTLKRTDGQIPAFTVYAFREARRLHDDGGILNQVFITLLQEELVTIDGQPCSMRCGSTLVIDLDTLEITYAIRKGPNDRLRRDRMEKMFESGQSNLAMTDAYLGERDEVFAALHNEVF